MKRIDGFPDYVVCPDGTVYAYRGFNPQPIVGVSNGIGYLQVGMVNAEGKRCRRYVHRLVAEAYVPNPDNLPEIDHIDSNKANNADTNLQWISHKANCIKRSKR